MPACPRCSRPIALARPTCLYCGAPLPEAKLAAQPTEAAAAADSGPVAPAPPSTRELIVLNLAAAPVDAVARALGLPAFEAEQRVRRGGYQLHRIADRDSARHEADRLSSCGLQVTLIPEGEGRAAVRPLMALGGGWEAGALGLRLQDGSLQALSAADLLLVVRGPISRALEPPGQFKRVRVAGPTEGHRIHLHRQSQTAPIELDPEAFEFGRAQPAGSSLLILSGWVRELSREVPIDEGFARLTPALGPAEAAETGALGAARALRESGGPGKRPRPLLLDNLAQFRFYSSWRAAVQRRADRPR